jgi:uncharacterized membrane protein YccF (DUF307 family)
MSFVAEMLMGIIVTTRFWFITIVSTIVIIITVKYTTDTNLIGTLKFLGFTFYCS